MALFETHDPRDDSRYDPQWIARNLLDFSSTPRARIFCFPHAGGQPSTFAKWPRQLGPEIEVCAISLPGRAARFDEPPAADMLSLARQVADAVARLNALPFALYGECSGALMALATARALAKHHARVPARLFAIGLRDPRPSHRHFVHLASDEHLRAEIVDKGLLDPAITSNEDALSFFLPQIRADYRLCETYFPAGEAALACRVMTVARRHDSRAESAAYSRWQEESRAGWSHATFQQESAGALSDPLREAIAAALLSPDAD